MYCFQFGKSLLPLSNPLVEMAKVSTERGVRLLGFLDEGQVPVHLFMGVRVCGKDVIYSC